jgi:putative ABC transport system permease protein
VKPRPCVNLRKGPACRFLPGQRRQEVGVRIALGARAGDVVRLIVSDGLRVVVIGAALGMALALLAAQWLGPLLFQVSPRDPVVFAAAALALVGVVLMASGLPAIRAVRVDPATSLRAD